MRERDRVWVCVWGGGSKDEGENGKYLNTVQ